MREFYGKFDMGWNQRSRLPDVFGTVLLLFAVFGYLATADLPVLGYLSAAETDQHLVDHAWLLDEMGSPDLVIIDTRKREAYLKSHIQGAVSVPVWDTFGPDPRSDLAAPISKIQALFSDAGVDQQTRVVLYDDGEMINAARVFWILETHGQERVSLLSPGFRQWVAAGLPSDAEPVQNKPRQFLSHVTRDRLATKLSTRLAIDDPNVIIIDTREEDEYRGKKSSSSRKGHIPGAVSVPYEKNFTEDGKSLRSFEELEALYSGLDRDKKVITYCNKGRHSALAYFILRQLGYSVSAYDGSWYEWGNDLQLPIENTEKVSD